MKLQLLYGQIDLTRLKALYPPRRIWSSNPLGVPVLLDLVDVTILILLGRFSHGHGRSIMPLVYIFEYKFHGLNAPACLNIDVTVKQPQQIRVVRDDPLIVQLVTPDFFPCAHHHVTYKQDKNLCLVRWPHRKGAGNGSCMNHDPSYMGNSYLANRTAHASYAW